MRSRTLHVTTLRADVESLVAARGSIDGWGKADVTTVVAGHDDVGLLRFPALLDDDGATVLAARPHLGWVTDRHPLDQTGERRLDTGFEQSADPIEREVIARGLVPHWDATRRQLEIGGHVLKQFCNPARNQEAILAAFQTSNK